MHPAGSTTAGRWACAAALIVALVATACASSGRSVPGASEPFGSPDRPQTVRLIVQNLNFSEARLYAVRRGVRDYLGVVGGKEETEYVMEWLLPEPLRIEMNLLAGPRCTTEEMPVDPGDILELQIPGVFSSRSSCRWMAGQS